MIMDYGQHKIIFENDYYLLVDKNMLVIFIKKVPKSQCVGIIEIPILFSYVFCGIFDI